MYPFQTTYINKCPFSKVTWCSPCRYTLDFGIYTCIYLQFVSEATSNLSSVCSFEWSHIDSCYIPTFVSTKCITLRTLRCRLMTPFKHQLQVQVFFSNILMWKMQQPVWSSYRKRFVTDSWHWSSFFVQAVMFKHPFLDYRQDSKVQPSC